jgi:hypothetical protein
MSLKPKRPTYWEGKSLTTYYRQAGFHQATQRGTETRKARPVVEFGEPDKYGVSWPKKEIAK